MSEEEARRSAVAATAHVRGEDMNEIKAFFVGGTELKLPSYE